MNNWPCLPVVNNNGSSKVITKQRPTIQEQSFAASDALIKGLLLVRPADGTQPKFTTRFNVHICNSKIWICDRLQANIGCISTINISLFRWKLTMSEWPHSPLIQSGHVGKALACFLYWRPAFDFLLRHSDLWHAFAPYKCRSGGTTLQRVGGNGQSIDSTVSNFIIRSWLQSSATIVIFGQIFNFVYFESFQRIKNNLQLILIFVVSVYVKKLIFICNNKKCVFFN